MTTDPPKVLAAPVKTAGFVGDTTVVTFLAAVGPPVGMMVMTGTTLHSNQHQLDISSVCSTYALDLTGTTVLLDLTIDMDEDGATVEALTALEVVTGL